MKAAGAYALIVGDSASWPVPGSGLVSMEQAAMLMMQRVLQAELQGEKRVFALILGPVSTRLVESGNQDWVTADQVGEVAVAASAARAAGRELLLHNRAEVDEALALLSSAIPDNTRASK